MSRTLIIGTSYVQGAAAAETFRMWADLTRRMNPDCDMLVIDSNSPWMPTMLHGDPDLWFQQIGDNIGHLSRSGRDGWGRAFSQGIEYSIMKDYDWVVHIECDLLFARPVSEVIDRLVRNGVRAAAPMAIPYQFVETALMFLSVPYIKEIDLIGRYDWERPPANGLLPEQRIGAICAEAMFALPLRGFRNDMGVTAAHLKRMFPQGIDWIHHAELMVLRKFLEMQS
jgi:hypothetical protein